jgi:hypothetical protein
MERIGWLIYRINDPVMRTMFVEPSNKFWMRDGIVNMLVGNLRGNLRSVLPVLCFKPPSTSSRRCTDAGTVGDAVRSIACLSNSFDILQNKRDCAPPMHRPAFRLGDPGR